MGYIKRLYVNFEASLLIETGYSPSETLLSCGGEKVQIEQCEMNTVRIGDTYYELGESYGELVEIREVM